ncbi:elongator complex protein 5 isoform X2 [Amborella trichopoda]|uniref:elongator complex protein 5 isoform X2 n=1 Tax=Amborella trichopoda TaxID=13333 RepID=UPI0005D419AC|nr:elongator complex protein 5 isoform X2 [Amborella trichopoda]|eukprot:XP_011622589.1 elongator complex protein 5 isoform X2 [Amborella trichopoda]
MADLVCRGLRDGVLEGEYAPALLIKDTLQISLGVHVFNHFLLSLSSNISSGKAQSRGLVVVAFACPPCFYVDLLRSRGIGVASLSNWIVDCYSDPLGWKDKLLNSGFSAQLSSKSHDKSSVGDVECLFRDVGDAEKLSSLVFDLGRGLVGPGKGRFSVAIDSASELLRHTSLLSVSSLINNLRSHDQVASLFWLLHSDLHEPRAILSLEYLSSMVAGLEPIASPSTDAQRNHHNHLFQLEQNSRRGKLHMRLKRRNGRVKILFEEFDVEQGGIKFVPVSLGNAIRNDAILPKVQFNLQLTDKERGDRAKVILPFEHQGNGEDIKIYDGRGPIADAPKNIFPTPRLDESASATITTSSNGGKGEIHYFRDSDEEALDTDEDPDDDLDI